MSDDNEFIPENDPYGMPIEPEGAIIAFDDFYNLGPGRTLEKLLQIYRANPNRDEVPTVSYGTLSKWHNTFMWKAKCAERAARLIEMSEALSADVLASEKVKQAEYCTLALKQSFAWLNDFQVAYDKAKEDGKLSIEFMMKYHKTMASLAVNTIRLQREIAPGDEDRMNVTIDKVISALPLELQEPVRESLFTELMKPGGQ